MGTEWDQIALAKEHAENRHGVTRVGCPVCAFVRKQPEWIRRMQAGQLPNQDRTAYLKADR